MQKKNSCITILEENVKAAIADYNEMVEESDRTTNEKNRLLIICNRLKTLVVEFIAKANARISYAPPTVKCLQISIEKI